MEVVGIEKKADETPKKTWTEVLNENIDKANKIATQIKEKVLLPQFTLVKMAELMRISREEAQQKMAFIGSFGFVEEKRQGGVMYFRIVTEPKDRIKNIEQAATNEAASHKAKMDYFEAMLEITTTYIKE